MPIIKSSCNKGHEWESSQSDINRGRGCPYCSNRRVCDDNSLAVNYPEISKEWDFAKNKLTPSDYVYESGHKVWWKCKYNHEWESRIFTRTKRGSKCPYCSGHFITKEKSIGLLYPELIEEIDFEKNIEIDIYKIASVGSDILWWKCKNGHSWKASVCHRTKRHDRCPYCFGKKVCNDNCLATKIPISLKYWSKKNQKTPFDYTSKSNFNAIWECDNGHEWQCKISMFSKSQNNNEYDKIFCPYCNNRKVSIDNCLDYMYPDLANEWDYVKNFPLTPKDVVPNSGKYVWWTCKNGHCSYKSEIYRRTHGSGCPRCGQGVIMKDGEFCHSLVEAWFYLKFKKLNLNFIHNSIYDIKFGKKRFDFYFPDENKYVEVTSFANGKNKKVKTFYIKYLRKIVMKKKFVEKELGANFEFIQYKLNFRQKKYVMSFCSAINNSKKAKIKCYLEDV